MRYLIVAFFVFVLAVILVAIPQSASARTDVFGSIISNTTWQAGEVYVVNGNVTVSPGVALTIESGAVVKFNFEASMTIVGSVTANGTSGNEIYFTSIRDDSVGGDTNGDGALSSPMTRDWAQIWVAPGADVGLDHSVVRLSGVWPQYTSIYQTGGTLNLTNSTMEFNITGLKIAGGNTVIENNIFKDNSYGLDVFGPGGLVLNDNLFVDNVNHAAIISFDYNRYFVSSGNVASGNGKNGMIVSGSVGNNQVWPDQMPYIISNNGLDVWGTLDISPGAKIKFDGPYPYLFIRGTLNANGSNDNDIYFTSIKDDSVGGDTNGDGALTSPMAGDWGQIFTGLNSVLNLNHAVVRYGGRSWPYYTNIAMLGGNLNMSNSITSFSSSYGLRVYDGSAIIIDSQIINNTYGIVKEGGCVSVSNSSIYGNVQYGIYNGTFGEINAENNWWGDASGPYNFWNNDDGAGDKVSTFIDFDPWLTSPPVFNDPDPVLTKEPVIIVPGILGSRLNRVSDGEEVWPNSTELLKPGTDSYLDQLKLDNLGNDIIDIDSTGILGREFMIFPFYENLIEKFEGLGYTEDTDLIVFDYDWRKDISFLATELKSLIDSKSSISPTGKVSIVAHSMGGLLTKEYLRQNTTDLSQLNNVVIAGAPQLGAIKAFKLLNFGDNLEIGILNKDRAKEISQNMPSVYQLLPSREYIEQSGGYLEDNRDDGGGVLNYDQTKSFMLSDPYLSDYRNTLMLNSSEEFHDNLDHLNINGPRITNLVGCSVDTLAGIKIFDNKKADIVLKKGDGTVPLVSANQTLSNSGQTNYYAAKGFDHFNLVSKAQALDLIGAVATDGVIPSLSDISSSESICYFNPKKLFIFSTHSPVNLRIYDSQGNYTGLDENGDVNDGILESDFMQIGENNFVLAPEGEGYRIAIDAYDTGSFDFKIRTLLGEGEEDSALYFNVPISNPNLSAEVLFDGDLNNILLKIDRNGDGDFDDVLTPNFVVLRLGQPSIQNVLENIEGAYRLGWIEDKAKEYLAKTLNHVDKLMKKDESKDDEINEILGSLIGKLGDYLRRGLINKEAYDIIREDIGLIKQLNV